MALVTSPLGRPETHVQVGVAASALVVLQMPPPAAAIQTRQNPALQPLCVSMARAVIRPETTCCEPVKVRRLGSVAEFPVTSCHMGNGGASGGLEASIVTVAGVGVGVGVPFPLFPPFF